VRGQVIAVALSQVPGGASARRRAACRSGRRPRNA